MTRWIELDGAVNVRDLGGLATSDGGTVRTGLLLRSDNLQGLTAADRHLGFTGERARPFEFDLGVAAQVDDCRTPRSDTRRSTSAAVRP